MNSQEINYLNDSPINHNNNSNNNNNNIQQKLDKLLTELNELIDTNSNDITIDKESRQRLCGLLFKNVTNDCNSDDKSLINKVFVLTFNLLLIVFKV